MDYALIGTIARLTNARPNWDRDVTRAVGAARACAIAVLMYCLTRRVIDLQLRVPQVSALEEVQVSEWRGPPPRAARLRLGEWRRSKPPAPATD